MTPDTTARDGARAAETPAKRRSPVLPILLLVALVAIGWGVKNYLYGRSHATTDNAQVDGSIIPVLAKVGGFVKSISVVENQPVKAGQVIVELDDSEFAVRLTQADAELGAALAAAGGKGVDGQAEAMIRSAQSQRQVVDAQIQSARAAQAKAAADLARFKELVAKQIVSKQQLDGAQAAFDQANANLSAAERQANSASAQLSNAEAGSKFAQARLAGAKATRENAALQLSYTKITAPLSGTVSRKQIECLDQCKLQGNAARRHSRRPAGRTRSGFVSGVRRRRKSPEPQRGDRREVRAPPARQLHRKLHEGRAARSRSHSGDKGVRRRASAASGDVGHRVHQNAVEASLDGNCSHRS
jgi:hypothetical protein